MKKFVLKLDLHDGKEKQKALKTVSALPGIDSISMDMKEKKLTVVGIVDPITTVSKLRKYWPTTVLLSVGPAKEPEKPVEKKEGEGAKPEEGKKEEGKKEGGEEAKKEEGKKEGGEEGKKEGGDDKKKAPAPAPAPVPVYDPVWEMMKARGYNPHMFSGYNHVNPPMMTYYNPNHHMMSPYNPPMTTSYYPPPMNTHYAQTMEENPNGTCTIS